MPTAIPELIFTSIKLNRSPFRSRNFTPKL
jgi:hypothetical protein